MVKTIGYLSCTSVASFQSNAQAVYVEAYINKTYGSLSEDVHISFRSYETMYRFGTGVIPYYSVIKISVEYNESGSGGIGCGPGVCPTSSTG